MRSRYTAYRLGRSDYLLDTWYPATRPPALALDAAQHWLGREGRPYRHRPCRFDALLLSGLSETRTEWLKGAFEMR